MAIVLPLLLAAGLAPGHHQSGSHPWPKVDSAGVPVLAQRPEVRAVVRGGSAPAASLPGKGGPATGCPGSGPPAYCGGSVDHDPQVYLIFWGSWWVTDTSGKAAKAQSMLGAFFSGLGLTQDHWSPILDQYYSVDNVAKMGPPVYQNDYICANCSGGPVLLGGSLQYGSIVDPSDPPSVPDEPSLATEAALAFSVSARASSNVIPMVILPPGSVSGIDVAHGYCGHHGWGFYDDSPGIGDWQPYAWAETSYDRAALTPTPQDAGCNYGDGTLGGFTIIMSHEYAEAVTDPYIPPNGQTGTLSTNNGYSYGYLTTDPSGGSWLEAPAWVEDIGDLCQKAGPSKLKLSTGTYWTTQLWNLSTGKCAGRA